MDKNETLVALAKIGLKGVIRKTGSPDYERCFVLDAGGVSLGRITIFQGAYSHIKWYGCEEYMGHSSFDQHSWYHLLATGEVLSRERWDEIVAEATRAAQEDHARKQNFRTQNPKAKGGRAKLAPPNPRRFIYRILNQR